MISYDPSYGSVSYDANGYMNFLPTPEYGANPWSSMVQTQQGNVNTAQGTAGSMLPQYQQNMQNQMSAFGQYLNTSGYPSFPNPGGFGSQTGYTQGSSPATNQTKTDSGAISRGLNPWSLQGEAMARY